MNLKFAGFAAFYLFANQCFASTPQAILQSSRQVKATFESLEHQDIGDSVLLKYPNTNVSGLHFDFEVKRRLLSFGKIVALAGDFFAHWKLTSCHESISDHWDSDPKHSIDLAKDNANLLRRDWEDFLGCVMDLMKQEGDTVRKEFRNGRDAAQVYTRISKGFDFSYADCTGGAYVSIALCNPDHFGHDAARAYKAVHSAALARAVSAHSEADLKEAYFIEAYGQHFMTDLFSAGHIRTPRRSLHSTSPFSSLKDLFNPFPGDRCAQSQHDEDSANGLWVTNALGQSWAAYGDKQLFDGRSAANLRHVVEACQIGVDEIWKAFQTHNAPPSTAFAALKKVPIPESTIGVGNFVPLFEPNPKDSKTILFRSAVGQRASSLGQQKVDIGASNAEWKALQTQILNGGPSANMYIFTRAFKSITSFLHLGLFGKGSDTILASAYGNVDSGSFDKWWSMQGSASAVVPKEERYRRWTDASAIGAGVVSLVARLSVGNKKTNAQHIGLGVAPGNDGKMDMKLLWNKIEDDGNSEYEAGQILYGNFDAGSKDLTLVKYFGNETRTSKVEAWAFTAEVSSPPTRIGTQIDLRYINFLISHKISTNDPYSILVGYGNNRTSSYWYFASWKDNYTKTVTSRIDEPGALPAQALLPDPGAGRLVRVHYGRRIPVSKQLRIDVQRPIWNDTSKSVVFSGPLQSQNFEITWPAFLEDTYLLWLLTDVNGDGYKDLVAYTSQENNIIQNVIVFPGQHNGTFSGPVVSPITLDPSVGSLLSAEFMLPLKTVQAQYTYKDGSSTDAGIMAFFDNYGIVGARMLAPKTAKGTYKYEFKGQNPSIAGQRSTTLGERKGTWMGLNKKTEVIGLLPF